MKNKIAAAFNKAVKSYDRTAVVQQTIANWLLQMLPVEQKLNHILDLGCGTGYLTNKLASFFPASKIYGIDFASKMIAHANCNYNAGNLEFLCADIENMPFINSFAELIFANCVFQWAPDLTNMLNEIRRILCQSGKLFFSTFVQGTLQELQNVCELNSFKTVAEIQQALMKSGFVDINLTTKNIVLQFVDMKALMSYFKKLGANYVANRKMDFMGKKTFTKLNDLGKITATFVVAYGYAAKG